MKDLFYVKKNSYGRLIICLFGIKIKFLLRKKTDNYYIIQNLLYELADKRTLQNIKLPKVYDTDASLELITHCEKSMARFGDGEFKLITGESISFQKYDENLSKKLCEILKNNNDNLYVGINDIFGYCDSDYMRKVVVTYRDTLYKYLNFDKYYIDTIFTRKLNFNSVEEGLSYYNKFKAIWKNKNIVIVEGAGSRLGVGNDLFEDASSIKRIICPIKNAFSKYDTIKQECLKQDKNELFILSLGPTATVLANELMQNGYRALDVGHIDTAYEALLHNSLEFLSVKGKVVFNRERHHNLIPECKDDNYKKQILADLS